jgi:hypothetical protein
MAFRSLCTLRDGLGTNNYSNVLRSFAIYGKKLTLQERVVKRKAHKQSISVFQSAIIPKRWQQVLVCIPSLPRSAL